MRKTAVLFAAATLALGLTTNANAALIDRGNGMIYDTVQDITWLADANYAKTSGYDSDGAMNWWGAKAWADQLVYGGFDDWRLADANPYDTNCTDSITPPGFETQYTGGNCIGSELGHLFYVDLGLSQGQRITNSTHENASLFVNLTNAIYWTGTNYDPLPSYAMIFITTFGTQGYSSTNTVKLAWAVRDGDVAAVSLPASALLIGVGLLGMVASRQRR